MTITHGEDRHMFVAYDEDGAQMGEIEYRFGGNKDYYATHTLVEEAHEGKGIAGQLLDAMVAWAEENGYKIVPICPYVTAAFQKHPEKYAAVMK